MKSLLLVYFLFYLTIDHCQSQDHFIIGKWITADIQIVDDSQYLIDCPDWIQINNDSTYVIGNDCQMTFENRTGQIENGRWDYFQSKNILELNSRVFTNSDYSNYRAFNPTPVLRIHIEKSNSEELFFSYDTEENNSIKEMFVRTK